MRVICPDCGAKARIGKTNRITSKVSDLYCSCSDPECGHSFVVNLCYSHTLSPSAKTTSDLAVRLVSALSPEKQKQLHEQLSML
ncbi:ogr/Delta-like zinc finger family protein [Vibrio sp. HN007]|uniref:ogr/Delta-like zinc finger family protein n=1 Tax=Vibrio iocasae TaxID=3098914 RepID=UPI0035D4DDAD